MACEGRRLISVEKEEKAARMFTGRQEGQDQTAGVEAEGRNVNIPEEDMTCLPGCTTEGIMYATP